MNSACICCSLRRCLCTAALSCSMGSVTFPAHISWLESQPPSSWVHVQLCTPQLKCSVKLEIDSSYFYGMVKYHIIYINKWNHLYKSKGNFSVKCIIFESVCIINISQILQYLTIAYAVGILKYFILCLPSLFQGSLPAHLLLPENWAAFSCFISDLWVHPHLQPWPCEPHTVQLVLKIKLFSLMFFLP